MDWKPPPFTVPWPGQSRKSSPADLWPEDVPTDSSGANLCGSVMERGTDGTELSRRPGSCWM